MKISTRIRINTYISVALLIILTAILAWSFVKADTMNRNEILSEAITAAVSERIMLRDDYLLNGQERSKAQWFAKTKTLGTLLDAAQERFTRAEIKYLLQEAQKAFAETQRIFSDILKYRMQEERKAKNQVDFNEGDSFLINQLLLKAYFLNDVVTRIHSLTRMEAIQARNITLLIIIIFVFASIMVVLINSITINRLIMKRLTALGKGLAVIGDGHLDTRIEVAGNDELSVLARLSNEMAEKLSRSHTSLENLRREVAVRKAVEEKLKQYTDELRRSNEDLEQFAYVASHDLQEPLRMVSSYTELLARHYEGRLDEKAKKFMDYAVDGATRMQRLINDLLAYSRVGTRGKSLEATDTHALLGEAIRNLAVVIEQKRAVITNDALPTVRADASQLVQLFQNLISNAIKFQGENIPHIHVSAQDKGREWVFSVRDNGIGIDRKYADRIFVIFQRLHTRQEYPGTGIGLAVCKKIVERHGGRIWFESERGKGSTFFFTIPK